MDVQMTVTRTKSIASFPTEALAFLGAVAVFLIILVIFFLYLNKKLCFAECGGFPCMAQPPSKDEEAKKLSSAYNVDDQGTSSDSDEEVRQRYNESIARRPSKNSHRSHKSSASKASKSKSSARSSKEDHPPDNLLSRAEKGERDGSSLHESHGSPDADRSMGSGATGDDAAMYENGAFQMDVSPDQPSSERALSADFGAEMEHDEALFDVSDLQAREHEQEPVLISKCGTLEVSFDYDAEHTRMNVVVHHAKDIPSKERGGSSSSQVRLLLLPTKKLRHKTKIKNGENPEFEETFQLKVPLEEVNNMGVRFRLYGCERMRRERMIGESVVGFASLNLDQETTHQLQLEPRSNLSHGDSKADVASLTRSDSASSTQSMQHGGMPELLIGLTYNGTTGRLSVEAIKGSNFRNMAMNRAPDTYVKLTLMSPNGQEIARSKTSIRRGQPNPLYKETFMFQVALFQLPDVTLMVSVYNKRSMKRKEMIGWFSLGLNNSGEEEMAHWTDMRESKGDQVCRWHVLLES